MARDFKETAHLNVNAEKYESNYDRIFRNKSKTKIDKKELKLEDIKNDLCDKCKELLNEKN